MRATLFFVAILFIQSATGAHIDGMVVNVADGDSITILDATKTQHRVRVNGIDAPEKGQAFGDRSREHLRTLVHRKHVMAICHKVDRYKRQVCSVWVTPPECSTCDKTLDVGHAQLLAGMAWWYRDYAKEQSIDDRERYESAESEARARRLGLWRDPAPVAPWEWRKKGGAASAP